MEDGQLIAPNMTSGYMIERVLPPKYNHWSARRKFLLKTNFGIKKYSKMYLLYYYYYITIAMNLLVSYLIFSFFIGKFKMDVNMTYLAKIHFAGTQIESGPNMSSKGHVVFMVY